MMILKRILIYLLKTYQFIFSPNHNSMGWQAGFSACRYYPSCSKYAVSALEHYGLFKGGLISVRRILRCNAFSPGGYDPLKK